MSCNNTITTAYISVVIFITQANIEKYFAKHFKYVTVIESLNIATPLWFGFCSPGQTCFFFLSVSRPIEVSSITPINLKVSGSGQW